MDTHTYHMGKTKTCQPGMSIRARCFFGVTHPPAGPARRAATPPAPRVFLWSLRGLFAFFGSRYLSRYLPNNVFACRKTKKARRFPPRCSFRAMWRYRAVAGRVSPNTRFCSKPLFPPICCSRHAISIQHTCFLPQKTHACLLEQNRTCPIINANT